MIDNISLNIIKETEKSICRIKYTSSNIQIIGSGFFVKDNSFYYLITCYHILSEDKRNIELMTWKKNIELNLNNRYIKYLPNKIDITLVQIKKNEIKDIEFLTYDKNYLYNGYEEYLGKRVYSLRYPYGTLTYNAGEVKRIDRFDFYHTICTSPGSCGMPILLSNKQVIGIHKAKDIKENFGIGIFIGEIFKEIDLKEIEKYDE